MSPLRAIARLSVAAWHILRDTVVPALLELRRSPSKVLAFTWLTGMLLFVVTAGERAEERWAAERGVEDAGPDSGQEDGGLWEEGGLAELDYLLDDEEGGEDDEGGEPAPFEEDAGDLLAAAEDAGALADLDEDGGDLADLDEEDGGLASDEDGSSRAVASVSDGGGRALPAEVVLASFDGRLLGESALLALAGAWPDVPQLAPVKESRAVRRLEPIDARSVGAAALRALDVAWPVDEQAAEIAAAEVAEVYDAEAPAEVFTRTNALALRDQFRAVVPPLRVRIVARERRVALWINEADPFITADGARLGRPAERDLARLAPILAAIADQRFRVVVPGASGALDVARARAVARVLATHGLSPGRLDWKLGSGATSDLATKLWAERPGAASGAGAGVAIVLLPRHPRALPEIGAAQPDAGPPATPEAGTPAARDAGAPSRARRHNP